MSRPPSSLTSGCADAAVPSHVGNQPPTIEVAILAEGVSVNRAYLAAMERGMLIPEEEPETMAERLTYAWPHCRYDLYSRYALAVAWSFRRPLQTTACLI